MKKLCETNFCFVSSWCSRLCKISIQSVKTFFKLWHLGRLWNSVSAKQYPEFKGRLVNINWSDIELAPKLMELDCSTTTLPSVFADSMPVIFMVYLG